MSRLDEAFILSFLCLGLMSCKGQVGNSQQEESPSRVGGSFENSEFTYLKMPKVLDAADTSPGWNQPGSKLLLTGTVYEPDGKTPASDVVLYYYHTNTEGRYAHKPEEERSMSPNNLGQTHGYIRGWVKTGSDGKYSIYTVRPGVYPTRDEPAHVHVTVKEPNDISEYYIDDFVFDDDELLNTQKRRKLENRCGSGVLRLVMKDDLYIGERDIILGLNIPDHPRKDVIVDSSVRGVGEDVFSFTPFHAWGPDKGTKTCPVCKYGWYHGVLYFVGNNPDWMDIKNWLTFLESESAKSQGYLKVYFVYGNEKQYSKSNRENELAKLGKELNLKHTALTFVRSFADRDSEVNLNEINSEDVNTIVIYKRGKIIGRFSNLSAEQKNFSLITNTLAETKNEYFVLPAIKR